MKALYRYTCLWCSGTILMIQMDDGVAPVVNKGRLCLFLLPTITGKESRRD
jgi:hypothetical protein